MTTNDEQQIRDIFAGWFEATARKDIDGVMTHIAADVVSYEHDAPLEYRGLDAVRAVCQRGFDASPGAITWTVPDMTIVVRGDLAVQSGLNRMTSTGDDGQTELWSRGTRVFHKRDGRWEMVHQHVSFPYDPASGAAAVDCTPATGRD